MGSLRHHISESTTKMLIVGDSSSGKTGSLCSLAQVGYNIRIIDTENGLDLLANLLSDPKTPYGPEAIDRIEHKTLMEKLRNVGGKLVPAKAIVWQDAMKLLDNWKTDTADLGPITTWGQKDVLVIDTLSSLCDSAMYFHQAMNAQLGQPSTRSDLYIAQQYVDGLIKKLIDDSVKCNVILFCHVQYTEKEKGSPKGYPKAVSFGLSSTIGKNFNNVIGLQRVGSRRKILTDALPNALGPVDLKTSAPNRVKKEYDQATGLAEFFRDLRGEAKP